MQYLHRNQYNTLCPPILILKCSSINRNGWCFNVDVQILVDTHGSERLRRVAVWRMCYRGLNHFHLYLVLWKSRI